MGNVRVIAPDGSSGSMPEEDFEAAKADGFRLADRGSAPAASPAAEPEAGRMVRVRAPDGTTGTMPLADLEAAEADGFKRADLNTGDQVRAGAEGLVRGASFGASDAVQAGGAGLGTGIGNWIADKVLGETPRTTRPGVDAPLAGERPLFDKEAAKESYGGIQQRREDYRGTALATEVAGAAIPALLSGGAGAAAAAARMTPAGQLAYLSTRMGQALTAGAAERGVASRLGGLVATGAAEGFADSATRTVMDDLAAGKVDLTAERMAEAAWHAVKEGAQGALVGGATAGTLGGLVEGGAAAYRAGKQLAGKAGQRISRALGGDESAAVLARPAASEVLPPASRAANTNDDALPPITEAFDPVAAQNAMGPLSAREIPDVDPGVFAKARASKVAYEQALDDSTRGVRANLDDFLRQKDRVDELAGIAAKRRAAQQYDGAGPIDPSTSGKPFMDAIDGVRSDVRRMIGDVGEAALQDGGGLTVAKRVESQLALTEKHIVDKLRAGDIGSAYMAADDMKRMLGKAARSRNSIASERFKATYEKFRGFMEDEAVFGDLAARQKAVNPAWSEAIRRDGDSFVGQFFRRSGESSIDPFESLAQSNDKAIAGLLESLGKRGSEGTEESFRRWMRASEIDAVQRARTWGTPELVEQAERMSQLSRGIEKQLDQTALLQRHSAKWEGAKQQVKDWTDSIPFAGALAKGATSTIERAANFAPTIVHKLAQRGVASEQALEKTVESTLKSIASPAARAVPIATRGAFGAVETQHMLAQARALSDPDSPEAAQLDAVTMQLAGDSPIFANAMKQQVLKQAALITQQMGPKIDPGDPLQSTPPLVDKVTQARNERFARAVSSPGEALDRLASGGGSPEDLMVVRTLTPLVHKEYVDRVMKQVIGRGVKLSIQQKQRLQYVLGAPVAREQTPAYVKFYQGLSQPQADASQPGNAPKLPGTDSNEFPADNVFASRSDALAGGP